MEYVALIIFSLLVAFHNSMFVVFIVALFRIFLVKYAPASSQYVGCYSLVHALYGGCPVIVIENAFIKYLSEVFFVTVSMGVPGSSYAYFGDFSLFVRGGVFIGGLLLVLTSYNTWFKRSVPINWRNIIQHTPLTEAKI